MDKPHIINSSDKSLQQFMDIMSRELDHNMDDSNRELNRVKTELSTELNDTKNNLSADLSAAKDDLNLKIDQTKNELTNQADTDRRSFTTKLTNVSKKAEAETAKAKADLSKAMKEMNDNLTTKIDTDFSDKVTSKLSQPGGIATLDQDGLVPSIQLPSYVDDVVEGFIKFDTDGTATFYKVDVSMLTEESGRNISEEDKYEEQNKIEGEKSKIYVDLNTSKSYRWSGTTYIEVSSTDVVEISEAEVKTIWAQVWGESVIEEVDPDTEPEVELSPEEKEEEDQDIIIEEPEEKKDGNSVDLNVSGEGTLNYNPLTQNPDGSPKEPAKTEPEITIESTEEVEDPSQKKEESEGQDVTVNVSGSGELNYDPRTQKPDGTPLDGAEEKKEEVDKGTTEEVDSGSETETDGSSDNQDVVIETVDPDESDQETEVESKDSEDEDVVIVEPEEETDGTEDTDKGSSEDKDSGSETTDPESEIVVEETETVEDPQKATETDQGTETNGQDSTVETVVEPEEKTEVKDGDNGDSHTEPEVEVTGVEKGPNPDLSDAGAEAANNTSTSVDSEASSQAPETQNSDAE